MKKNTRFVLLDMNNSSYTVYDDRVPLACYTQENPSKPEYQNAEEVEEMRTYDYKVSA